MCIKFLKGHCPFNDCKFRHVTLQEALRSTVQFASLNTLNDLEDIVGIHPLAPEQCTPEDRLHRICLAHMESGMSESITDALVDITGITDETSVDDPLM